MAGASLLTLLDDIAAVLDDVAVMTKVAAKKSAAVADDVAAMTKLATKKTAGVLGDDLALNAQQVTGVRADRELPVVWAVAKGSLLNKVVLVPAALAISFFLPGLITPLLMLGGAFLCYEGVEKLAHKFLHRASDDAAAHAAHVAVNADAARDMVAFERGKIKGAIRTDFILSAEIIVIALGTVADKSFAMQCAVLAGVAVLLTIGVYGLVAAIVKMDDVGLYLHRTGGAAARVLGTLLLLTAPRLMQLLTVLGTLAMFLVGGGILAHGLPGMHDVIHHLVESVASLPTVGAGLAWVAPAVLDAVLGVLAGALALAVVTLGGKLFKRG